MKPAILNKRLNNLQGLKTVLQTKKHFLSISTHETRNFHSTNCHSNTHSNSHSSINLSVWLDNLWLNNCYWLSHLLSHNYNCSFRVISCFNLNTTCWKSSPEKFYPLKEVTIRTLEEIKIYFGMCYWFCTNKIFISHFDKKLFVHSSTLNLHVFVNRPSWIFTSVNTHWRSPFLLSSNSHNNKGIHSVKNARLSVSL